MPYKSPAMVSPYNWTGFYLGINGGGGWGGSDWNGMGVGTSPSGGMIGLTAGYNWQGTGNPWVFGLEGDIDWTGVKGSTACGCFTCQTRNNWLGTVRGRVGYAWDRIMPYFTVGAAFGNIEAKVSGPGRIERIQRRLDHRRRHRRRHRRNGPPRSSICTRISATPPAARLLAASRATSTCASTCCVPA